MMTRVTKSLAV